VVNTSEDEDAIVDIASPPKDVGGGKALRRSLALRGPGDCRSKRAQQSFAARPAASGIMSVQVVGGWCKLPHEGMCFTVL